MQTAAAHNLQLADGVEPVHLAAYDRFMARAGGYGRAGFSVTIPNFGDGPLESALQDVEPNLKLLGLLNVKYLASEFPMPWPDLTLETRIGNTYIYANERPLPRAWVAHQAVPIEADWLSQLERLPDIATTALIDPASATPLPAAGPGRPSAVHITHYSADLIEMETAIDAAGWLILSEIWYPGWQATVNGTPVAVERVNGLLRGVYLAGPGEYNIRLVYRPRSVMWGNWIAGLSLSLVSLAGLGWIWFRSRRPSTGPHNCS